MNLNTFFCMCKALQNNREKFWNSIDSTLPIEVEVYLHNLSDNELVCALLGARLNIPEIENQIQVVSNKLLYIVANSFYVTIDELKT